MKKKTGTRNAVIALLSVEVYLNPEFLEFCLTVPGKHAGHSQILTKKLIQFYT